MEEISLAQETENYIDHLRQQNRLREQTLRAYQADLKRLAAFGTRCGTDSAADMDGIFIRQFMEYLSAEGISGSSLRRMASVLRGFFFYLLQEGRIDTDWSDILGDCICGLSAEEERQDGTEGPLSDLQLRALLAVPDQNDVSGLRDIAMIRVLADTGIRTGELLSIRVCDVDFLLNEVSVSGQNGQRRIPVSEQTVQALRDYIDANRYYLQSRSSLVFLNRSGEPLSRQALWKRIRSCGAHAGIKGEVNAERLRKTAAAGMAQNGMPLTRIQKLLGHAEPAVTRRMIRKQTP